MRNAAMQQVTLPRGNPMVTFRVAQTARRPSRRGRRHEPGVGNATFVAFKRCSMWRNILRANREPSPEPTSRSSGRDGTVAGLAFFGSLIEALRRWRRGRCEAHELLAMTDRELRDVGLTKADVIALLEGPVRPTTASPRPHRPAVGTRSMARQGS